MLVTVLSLALLVTAPQEAPPPAQDPTTSDEPVALEDVTVTGRRLDDLVRSFVGEVAEPNRGRRLARWDGEICVGVANLRGESAQYLVDRVSTVAEDLGLETGAPGCAPNLMIIATDDGSALAKTLVEERKRAFRLNASGTDRGGAALRDFQNTDRPVRWWQLSMPVDSETGARAVRIQGDCTGTCSGGVLEFAPIIDVFAASRLQTQIVNNIFRTVVIVDVDQVETLSIQQLADYIAMVSLAQIDPDADTTDYQTILNVMNYPEDTAGLTTWDTAYLRGLYGAERGRINLRADKTEIANSIQREHERLRDDASND